MELRDDGTARVACGTQDIGTGTYTILAQLAAEKTGVPVNEIDSRGNPILWAHDIPITAKKDLAVAHGEIYFGGLTNKEAAAILGISPRTADTYWFYARSWLRADIRG